MWGKINDYLIDMYKLVWELLGYNIDIPQSTSMEDANKLIC